MEIRHKEKVDTFWGHLASMRSHMLWAVLFFIICSFLLFVYGTDYIISYLFKPLKGTPIVFLSPLGPLLFKMQVSLYGGLALSAPIWLALLIHFIFPVIPSRQKWGLILFILSSLLLAILSIAVTYFYFVPITLNFLLTLVVPGTAFLLTANNYLDFLFLQTLVVFIILESPLIIVMFTYIGLVNPHTLAQKRQFLYMTLIIFLAIITPTTDAITLAVVFVPTILLVEVGLLMAKVLHKRMDAN